MFRRLLVGSRFFVLIAVVGSLVASFITMFFGGIAVITSTLDVIQAGDLRVEGA